MTAARSLDIAVRLAAESRMPLDRLPYTPAFDEIYARYVKEIGKDCSRHECWWALINARKRGRVGTSRRRPHGPDGKA